MSEQNVSSLMETTLEKIKTMFDADTVIGEKIVLEGVTIIPVSKLSFGFASGGSDIPSKSEKNVFAGGGGAGATVTPVGFLAVKDGDVRMISVTPNETPLSIAIEMLPEAFQKIKSLFESDKNEKTDLE